MLVSPSRAGEASVERGKVTAAANQGRERFAKCEPMQVVRHEIG